MSHRILTELIEADVEIAFNLVDAAEECLSGHDLASARRVLHDADDVLLDIGRRMEAMGGEKGSPFDSLLSEVRRAIVLAKSHANS